MVENSNIIEQLIMQAGATGLLIYLTFRIFKVLDRLTDAIRDVELKIVVVTRAERGQDEKLEA